MTDETASRTAIVACGKSLFDRGLTGGSSGNLSVRLDDGFLTTPTNSCLGFLDPHRLSRLDESGRLLEGEPPTKELPLHLAFYRARPEVGAVVHLHSSYATALSCLKDIDPENGLPAITPYVVMRVGKVPVIPYVRPGSEELGSLVRERAPTHLAFLLANHGPVLAATSLDKAIYAMEELEEAAKLLLLTKGMNVRYLSDAEIGELRPTLA